MTADVYVMKRIAMMRKLRMVAVLAAAVALPVYAQTLEELKNDGKNTDNVLTYGMGYHQNRYSSLKQINKSNVKRLVPVWNLSLDNQWGEQAQPLIYNGVMYVTNAKATVAIDVSTGVQLWKTPVDWLPETPRVVCCGVSNKGAAIYDGKVFRTTLDACVAALGEAGNETWPQDSDAWAHGGGSAWITGSYDPELDLTYWGTGNPAPWASQSRPGDNLYTSSLLAIRPKTGEVFWHYQFTPGDA